MDFNFFNSYAIVNTQKSKMKKPSVEYGQLYTKLTDDSFGQS